MASLMSRKCLVLFFHRPSTLSSYTMTAFPPSEKFGPVLLPLISVCQLICLVCSHVSQVARLCLVVKTEVEVIASASRSLEAKLGSVLGFSTYWLLGGGCMWIHLVLFFSPVEAIKPR